jgi:hypothetical protein
MHLGMNFFGSRLKFAGNCYRNSTSGEMMDLEPIRTEAILDAVDLELLHIRAHSELVRPFETRTPIPLLWDGPLQAAQRLLGLSKYVEETAEGTFICWDDKEIFDQEIFTRLEKAGIDPDTLQVIDASKWAIAYKQLSDRRNRTLGKAVQKQKPPGQD